MRRLILVLGMHRSGTSVITRALETLGVCLGDDLLPGKEDNPKGFFEDRKLQKANDDLLVSNGCYWDSVELPFLSGTTSGTVASYQDTITSLISGNESWIFGFKDPRMCRLWPLWDSLLRELDINTSVVLMMRHPFAVAKSLASRDAMPWEISLLLWRLHNIGAIEGLIHWGGSFVSYEILLENPEQTIRTIAQDLNLYISDTKSIEYFMNSFFDRNLNHYEGGELLISANLHDYYEYVYQYITDDTNSLEQKLAILRQSPSEESFIYPSISRLQQQRDDLRRHLFEIRDNHAILEAHTDSLLREVERRKQESANLRNRAIYLESLIVHERIKPYP